MSTAATLPPDSPRGGLSSPALLAPNFPVNVLLSHGFTLGPDFSLISKTRPFPETATLFSSSTVSGTSKVSERVGNMFISTETPVLDLVKFSDLPNSYSAGFHFVNFIDTFLIWWNNSCTVQIIFYSVLGISLSTLVACLACSIFLKIWQARIIANIPLPPLPEQEPILISEPVMISAPVTSIAENLI